MNAPQLLSRFQGVRQIGSGWLVKCPAHDDQRQSLSVGIGENGSIVMFCHAGCEPRDILSRVGLQLRDLFQDAAPPAAAPRPRNLPPGIVKAYDYTDIDGTLVYQVCRKADKSFLQRRPDGQGGWIWKTGRAVKRVPYRWSQLVNRATVYVVEGEKDADNLWAIDLPATTNAGGAGKWGVRETRCLREAGVTRVIILPDNDAAGATHANDVAAKCRSAGLGVSIVSLPGLPEHGDVSDWLSAGHSRAELEQIVAGTPYVLPPPTAGAAVQPGAGPDPAGSSVSTGAGPAETGPDALADPTKYAPRGSDGVPYDVGAAEAFCDRFGDRVRYDHTQERWLIWHEHYWRPDESDEVKLLAKRHIDLWQQEAMRAVAYPYRAKLVNFLLHLDKRSALENMLSCATWQQPISTSGNDWDANTWLLGVPNGVVDLKTGELRAGQRTDWITQQAGAIYDPHAECPRWMQFLNEVLCDDQTLIDYVWRALGYSLTGDMREQCFFLAIGAGANGKSIFLDTLEVVWGTYGHRANMRIFVGSGDTEKFHLAELDKRRLIFAAETKPNTRMNEHVVKNFTGGESQSAERKFGQPFTFKPIGKLWLGVNFQPRVLDESFGFWRRVRVVPFDRTFTGSAEDRGLRDKLQDEAPGILAWAVRGCLEWQIRGLEAPEKVRNETDSYQEEEDPLTEFLNERCIVEPDAVASFAGISAAYHKWAEQTGIPLRDRLSRRSIGNSLKRRFATSDLNGQRRYRGVEVKPAHIETSVTMFDNEN